MGRVAFVEILDRRGNVRERVRVDSFPATVGRGYGNAVIADDRLVDAEHLRLSLGSEGEIIVEDLHTLNGTRLSKSRERIQQHCLPPGGEAVLRIGQTVLRLRGDDFAIGATASSHTRLGPVGRYIESGMIALLAFVVGFGLNVFMFAQGISKKVIWPDLIGMSLVLLIIFIVWVGFWSFLSRLVVHSFRFMTHLAIASMASIVFITFFTAAQYFEFIFSAPATAEVARFAGSAVILSFLLYGHLSVMSELSDRRRILTSSLLSAGIVGIVLLITYVYSNEFSNEIRFSSVIKPLGRPWVRTVSSDEFFGDLDKLRVKIDAIAQKGPKEKTGDRNQERP